MARKAAVTLRQPVRPVPITEPPAYGTAEHMVMMLRQTFRNDDKSFGGQTVMEAADFFEKLITSKGLEKWKP